MRLCEINAALSFPSLLLSVGISGCVGFNRSLKRTNYEERVGESSLRDKNASRESDKKGEKSKVLNCIKLLFNII